MSTFVRIGKKVKKFAKSVLLPEPKTHVGYCRRIERVKTNERVCAMTFDDGPMDLPAAPDLFGGRALTDVLLDVLDEFNAKGTFDVVGTTAENYPDVKGAVGTPAWGGVAFDHYPAFECDGRGGAVSCPQLMERIIREGHQITNHGYRHVLFGKKSFVYGKRHTLGSLDRVLDDLTALDRLLRGQYGYSMCMSRPPHYVDRIDGVFTSYDAYEKMGYQYLAASFDGAGWLPSKSESPFEAEVDEMVLPLQKKLEEDPDSFCGQIIFQKDGYNMGLRTPVAVGLRRQLELLTNAGYRVVTVQELLDRSPFADVGADDPDFETFRALAKTHAVAYSNNTLQPDKPMTCGEFAMLAAPREAAVDERLRRLLAGSRAYRSRYSGAMAWCREQGLLPKHAKENTPLNAELLKDAAALFTAMPEDFSRRAVLRAFQK
ncbi:MAG: polysaccharide deacetylase family protein [Oscillospiraceae bacterium]|nr:polysaccharide deacetylase family protein [Oscillospiraceae bacterium]